MVTVEFEISEILNCLDGKLDRVGNFHIRHSRPPRCCAENAGNLLVEGIAAGDRVCLAHFLQQGGH